MAFWIPMAIGAGVGLLKNREEQKAVKRQNEAAAAQTEYSALTGMGPGQMQSAASPWEGMLQGAMAGAQFGQAGKAAGIFGGGGASAAPQMAGVQGSQGMTQGSYQNRQNPWANMGGGMYS